MLKLGEPVILVLPILLHYSVMMTKVKDDYTLNG